jgi:uncharacterized protein (TIGR03000 family)
MIRPARFCLVLLAIAAFPDSSRAQVYGGLGYYPGTYNGFWSNGFTMYGPPVPTYGSIPGYFGGSDQRLNNYNFSNIYIQNGASMGLGSPGSGGAGPRRRHWYGSDMAATNVATGQATIDVRVPVANAEVFFEGNNTKQNGVRRLFLSPVLEANVTHFYKVRATWKLPDGSIADQEKSVAVRANMVAVVDFTSPAKVDDKQPIVGAPQ